MGMKWGELNWPVNTKTTPTQLSVFGGVDITQRQCGRTEIRRKALSGYTGSFLSLRSSLLLPIYFGEQFTVFVYLRSQTEL